MINLRGANLDPLRQQVIACLERPLPGAAAHRHFAPELAYGRHAGPAAFDARKAAVLVLVYLYEGEWFIPTMVRAVGMKQHAGQIALPGGTIDAGETSQETALREFEEELGASRNEIDVLGPLTPIYVFNSNFYVSPFLGISATRPSFQPSADEVAELIEIPLAALMAKENHGNHQIRRRGLTFRTPHIQIGQHRIWGATCMILSEVMAIMDECAALGGA